MSGYVLDTNVLSELTRAEPNQGVVRRFGTLRVRDTFGSVMTLFELRHGAMTHPDSDLLWANIRQRIMRRVTWLDLNVETMLRAADIEARLDLAGQTIGTEDSIIGAAALEYDMPLVTRNVRHFGRIEGLKIENWFDA